MWVVSQAFDCLFQMPSFSGIHSPDLVGRPMWVPFPIQLCFPCLPSSRAYRIQRRAGNLSASASWAALAPCRELVGLPCDHPHCSSRDGLPKHAGLVKLHAASLAQPTAQHRQCPQILPPQEPGLDSLGLATQAWALVLFRPWNPTPPWGQPAFANQKIQSFYSLAFL